MPSFTWMMALLVLGCSCRSTKKNTVVAREHEVVAANRLPGCIQSMIEKFKAEERQNPPRQIFAYQYKGQTVYYVTAPCCDFFSELYDSTCLLMAQPDGGFTGRGDGRAPDFADLRTQERLIWKDERKP